MGLPERTEQQPLPLPRHAEKPTNDALPLGPYRCKSP